MIGMLDNADITHYELNLAEYSTRRGPKMVEIKFVTKADGTIPDKYITYLGGVRQDGQPWKLTEEEVIQSCERNIAFFVTVDNRRLRVIVAKHNRHRFLKTVFDRDAPDILLSLPDCP